jgi:hypothetical protein
VFFVSVKGHCRITEETINFPPIIRNIDITTDKETIGDFTYEYMKEHNLKTDKCERKLTQLLNTRGEFFVCYSVYLYFLIDTCGFEIEDVERLHVFTAHESFHEFATQTMKRRQDKQTKDYARRAYLQMDQPCGAYFTRNRSRFQQSVSNRFFISQIGLSPCSIEITSILPKHHNRQNPNQKIHQQTFGFIGVLCFGERSLPNNGGNNQLSANNSQYRHHHKPRNHWRLYLQIHERTQSQNG